MISVSPTPNDFCHQMMTRPTSTFSIPVSWHPTYLFLIEPLSHPPSSMDVPTTPPLPFTIPFTFPITTQPLPIQSSPATSAQQTHHTPHPHTSFPYKESPDYTYPLVPITHTLVDPFCSFYTFHQIQLPKHHTPFPLPIRHPPFPRHTSCPLLL